MAFFNEAWFIHAVNETVIQLAQQKKSQVRGSIRTREGVTGKTDPWQRIGEVAMQPIARDSDTTYLNPPQSKRRAVLVDRAAAVLMDDLDQVRMLINPQSEFSQILTYAREKELDNITLAKSAADPAGHYSRPDVTRLLLNKTPGDRVVSHVLPGMVLGEGLGPVEPALPAGN